MDATETHISNDTWAYDYRANTWTRFTPQSATDLIQPDWRNILTNATPPVSLPLANAMAFYRILAQ